MEKGGQIVSMNDAIICKCEKAGVNLKKESNRLRMMPARPFILLE